MLQVNITLHSERVLNEIFVPILPFALPDFLQKKYDLK